MNGPAGGPWLPYTPPRPDAAVRVFCLPHAGGSAAFYRPWIGRLPAGVEVLPVEYPGRHSRAAEPAHTTMDALVGAAWSALAEHLDRPYVLFGHSLGAAVGYQLAQVARASGWRPPAHLFAAAHRAPHLPPPLDQRELSDQQLLALVRTFGGTPAAVLDDPATTREMLRVLRADLAVSLSYRYRPAEPLDCPITVFGGMDDALVPAAQLAGWQKHSRWPVRLSLLPGGHFFIRDPRPVIDRLARVCRTLRSIETALA